MSPTRIGTAGTFLLLCLVVVWASLGGVAHADNKTVAKAAFQEGTRQFDLANFDRALESFKRAYLAYEEPAFLFNIAQCHRALGNRTEAVRFYRTFLRKVPEAPNHKEVRAIVATLEAELAAERSTASAPPQGVLAPTSAEVSPPKPAHLPAPSATPAPVEPAAKLAPTDQPSTAAGKTMPIVEAAPPRNAGTTTSTKRPVYKTWWLWTAVGLSLAVVGAGVAGGLIAARPSEPVAPTVRFP